jgi:hypothetical protein
MERVKLKIVVCILCEFVNRYQVFGNVNDMQDIKEINYEKGEREAGVSNVFDGKPIIVSNSNLIGSRVYSYIVGKTSLITLDLPLLLQLYSNFRKCQFRVFIFQFVSISTIC